MNDLAMSVENIVSANGVTIAIMGMLIVFSALAILSLFIALLPKLLPLLEKVVPEKHQHATSPRQPAGHEQMLAAIGYALFRKHAESLPVE